MTKKQYIIGLFHKNKDSTIQKSVSCKKYKHQAIKNFGNIKNTKIQEVLESDIYKNLVKNYKKIELCKICNMRIFTRVQ